jgi:hypothetical protein
MSDEPHGQGEPGKQSEDSAPVESPINEQEGSALEVSVEKAGQENSNPPSTPTSSTVNVPLHSKLLKRLTDRNMRRALLSGAGLVFTGALATIIGALAIAWFSAPGSPDVTQQILFQPWNVNGAGNLSSDVGVVSREHGLCWIHSAVTGRPDAYSCAYGNLLLDP